MAGFQFISTWHIQAPLQEVFDSIVDSLRWPDWWPGVEAVEERLPGDAEGIGDIRRYVWKSRLPYRLRFVARTTRVEPMQTLEAAVSGDLEGSGRWSFRHVDGVTIVHYDWQVMTTKRWMNLIGPLGRPMFAANHHALMRQGAKGLARRLGARLLHVDSREPSGEDGCATWWIRGVAAGIAAGIAATLVQLGLWWSASYSVPGMLLRDSRLAAAIVLGPSVLPPPTSFEWPVFIAATLVHGGLSVAYGLFAPLLARRSMRQSLAAGALFGFLLYLVNMYGFTALFPWFTASRDWITAVAHVVFGLTLAGIYKSWDSSTRTFIRK